ncbi:hypothetical protein CI15_33445 [Paraburkholderia monticola]|uniref:Uncharacterized protein n=1 Tax=Paraburkholderia monticola TaxID=1399968 RepID=A0A149PBN8_9BURK|nr:hypothetical protein [Paraburkholderia monticola]KXU82441.1 hypothetical protein CI15_33445 [Paraburkholderia monticola]
MSDAEIDTILEKCAKDVGDGPITAYVFARAIEQASRRAALEEAAIAALAKLKDLTREMEGDSWYGSHPGIPEDDYEDVADAIRALSAPAKDGGSASDGKITD